MDGGLESCCVGRVYGADVATSVLRALTSWNLQGLSRPVMGLLYFFNIINLMYIQ